MKNITIAGNIGKDAETRSAGDTTVTGFSVAVADRSAKDAPAFWFDCSIWGGRGEKLAPYLTKGSKVAVTGELTRRDHDGKTYMGVRVADVTLMGGGQEGASYNRGPENAAKVEAGRRVESKPTLGDIDDDIPFLCEWR